MRIDSIELTNFKKHRSAKFDFAPGSNMIVGNNYAGKSTIMQAILVGLFGNSAAPCNKEDLVSDGATDFKIRLFLSNGTSIVRTLRDSTIANQGEEPFARGHTSVNRAISEMLNMSKDTFLRVFASEQGSPQKLLDMEGAELQKFIEQVIGIDKLDALLKAVNRRASSCKDKTEALDFMVLSPEALEAVEAELSNLQARAEALQESHRVSLEQHGATAALVASKSAELENVLNDNRAAEAYQSKLDTLTNQLQGKEWLDIEDTTELAQGVKQRTDELNSLEQFNFKQSAINHSWATYEARKAEITTELEEFKGIPAPLDTAELRNRYTACSDEYDSAVALHHKRKALESEIDELNKSADALSSKLREMPKPSRSVAVLEGIIDDLQRDIHSEQTALATYESLQKDAVCPTCKRPHENVDLVALEARISEATQRLGQLRTRRDELLLEKSNSATYASRDVNLQEASARISSKYLELRALPEVDLEAARSAKYEAEEAYSSAVAFNKTVEGKLTARDRLIAQLGKLVEPSEPKAALVDTEALAAELSALSAKLRSIELSNSKAHANNEEITKLRGAIAALVKPAKPWVDPEPLKNALEAYKADLEALSNKLSETKDLQHEVELEVLPLRVKKRDHEEAYSRCKSYYEEAENLKYISQLLSNSRTKFISEAMATIFSVASEFAKLSTNGDIEEVLFDGNIKYKENGVVRGKLAASGAQQAVIGLGMKLGIANLVVSDFGAILLDEATAAMSEEISLQTSLAMGSLCEQSISISHRKMDIAGNVISL